jgi:sialic acid synthase SpsE/RimJ/RimL family protein N-acetyltransferase
MFTITFQKAKPTAEDANLVMAWRNDPATLKHSFHTQPKSMPAFLAEFKKDYFAYPELAPIFALSFGRRVGFLRFRPYQIPRENQRAVEISINLAPQERGKGLGSAIIFRATQYLFEMGYQVVVAEIKRDNVASVRAFEHAGYLFYDAGEHRLETGEKIPIYRLVKRAETTQPQMPHFREEGVFIVAEAGSNWKVGSPEEDLATAKALIAAASKAGADAVKFQVFRAESVYVENAGDSDYLSQAGIKDSIVDIFRQLAMPYEMIPELAEHCKKHNIQFMATPFSVEDAQAVDPFVAVHKNASYEISHIRLLKFFADSGKPLLLSTGAADIADIDWAVDYFFAQGGAQLCLLQCTAKYPAPPESLNLRVIPQLIARYGLPLGLSDHSKDPLTAPLSAVALGASVIEKHFTLDNSLPGPDQVFSITPDELKQMVVHIRELELALGSGEKVVQAEEEELRAFARRGIQATRDIRKGEPLRENENIGILRPGKQRIGLHPGNLPDIEGKPAKRRIPLGDGIQEGDY